MRCQPLIMVGLSAAGLSTNVYGCNSSLEGECLFGCTFVKGSLRSGDSRLLSVKAFARRGWVCCFMDGIWFIGVGFLTDYDWVGSLKGVLVVASYHCEVLLNESRIYGSVSSKETVCIRRGTHIFFYSWRVTCASTNMNVNLKTHWLQYRIMVLKHPLKGY